MHWTALQHTSYNKYVAFALDSMIIFLHVDTVVETSVLHRQAADGDGVVHQESGCFSPVDEFFLRADIVSLSVIVDLFLFLKFLPIQIQPSILFNAARMSFSGTLKGGAPPHPSVHYNVICHKRERLSD